MSIYNVTTSRMVERKKKELGLYLSTNHVFSYHGITDFVYIATRGVGKSVIGLETGIILKRKYGYENVKIYWFRMTDISIKALLANHAEKAVDPYLIHQYDMDITSKGNTVYDHGKPLIEFYPLVSAGSKGKGVNLYDCTWWANPDQKRFIVTVWDEFIMAEGIEKRSLGDPVEQYKIYREAIFRDAEMQKYDCAYNFLLANNVGEAVSVTGQLYNYIPDPTNFNRVKLTRKHAMVWNVPITEVYKEKRKKSINSNILDLKNDPNYANIEKDLSLIKPKKQKLQKVSNILVFGKSKTNWYCVYDDKYIRKYNGETVSKDKYVYLRRYLDGMFYTEKVDWVLEMFDTRSFMFADLISMAGFQAQLKLLKPK